MFKKTGENLPVINYLDDDGSIVCQECGELFVTAELNEEGGMDLVCECQQAEMEQIDA